MLKLLFLINDLLICKDYITKLIASLTSRKSFFTQLFYHHLFLAFHFSPPYYFFFFLSILYLSFIAPYDYPLKSYLILLLYVITCWETYLGEATIEGLI